MAQGLRREPTAEDRPWTIVGRRQEYEGEARANVLRLAGIAAFYLVELANYQGLRFGGFELPRVRDRPFHLAMTALAVAWTMLGLIVQLCLRSRFFPPALKYATTAADLVLLTSVLLVADGPRSPAVAAYFVILALAALRFHLNLMRCATAGAVAGYLVLLGYAAWVTTRDLRVPRYHQAFVLLALLLTGITLGQVVRRARSLARAYAERSAALGEGQP